MDTISIIRFVAPYYNKRDIMHDFSHIERISHKALCIKRTLELEGDEEILLLGCYFHGIIRRYENDVREFLQSNSVEEERIDRIIQCAIESHVQAVPHSLEGMIAHDAHLLEGGKYFLITKTLVTGTLKGQSLKETVEFLEKKVINEGVCCFPQNQEKLLAAKKISKEYIDEMKRIL